MKSIAKFASWLGRSWRRFLPWVTAVVALLAVLALIVLQLVKRDGAADSTTVALAAIMIALLFAVLAPLQTRYVLRRITGFKVAGLELGLAEIKRAERVRPLPGENDGVEVGERPLTGDAQTEYRKVVDQLKSRLRFTWDILALGQSGEIKKTAYVPIAEQLRGAKLLSRDEEKFIFETLGGSDLQVADWSAVTSDEFLDSAWEFATRFGPLIWDRYVRRELEKRDWLVADFQQQPGHRRDFLGYWNGKWSVLAARVAGTDAHPDPLEATRRRLEEFAHGELVAGRRIVIPDIRVPAGEDLDVKVLTLSQLLDNPTRAFDSAVAATT
jgi:hypothetical protein